MKAALALLLLVACASPRPAVQPPVDVGKKFARVENVIEHCQRQGAYLLCETEPWLDALGACGELYRAAGLCTADLEECRGMASVDQQEMQGKVNQANADRDRAKLQRWIWAAVGLAIGAAGATAAALWR
jgi:hypothetical protein